MVVVTVFVLGAGCSGATGVATSPTTSTTTPVRLTKEEFVAQANAICQVSKDESNKIDQELRSKYPDPKAVPEDEFQVLLKDAVERLLPYYRKQVQDLRALKGPLEDEATLNAGIEKLDAAIKELEADPNAIGKPAWSAYQPGYDYGLTTCFAQEPRFEPIDAVIS
jgi:hypothetical protein